MFDTDLRAFMNSAHRGGQTYDWAAAAAALGFGPQKKEALTCAALNQWKVSAGRLTFAQWKRWAKRYGYR